MKNILILAANPKGTTPLRLDREVRDIDQALRDSSNSKGFKLHQRWALRPRDLQRALLEVNPEIVHFCGHGEGTAGIALEDATGQAKLVPTAALANLFSLCAEHVNCVLLNACYAEVQADAIVQSIDYVIGMRKVVPDDVAIAFSTGFYQGIATGQSIEAAFTTGCNAIKPQTSNAKSTSRKAIPMSEPGQPLTPSIPDEQIPVLKKKVDL